VNRIKLIMSALILLFCMPEAIAQNISSLKDIKGIESYADLPFVYGWHRNPDNDKWSTKENEIKNIDKFESYSILTFTNQNNKYIAIIKEYKEKGSLVFDTYILDCNDYVSKISLWETNSLLKFPILKFHQAKLKKKEAITKQLLGLADMSDLKVYPRDYFVFQYKFFPDSTVKFLFYVESCSADICVPTGLNIEKENESGRVSGVAGKESLYDNFFYKTIYKYFVAFTDFPLKEESN